MAFPTTTLTSTVDTASLLQARAFSAGIPINPGLNRQDYLEFVLSELLINQPPMPSGTAYGAVAGAANSDVKVVKSITALADTVATTALTITVPNVKAAAIVRVTLNGSLGAGGTIGAGEATHAISYDFCIGRTAGVAAVGLISTAYGSAKMAVAGATTVTTAGLLSAVSGAVGVTNTFTITCSVTKAAGSSDNHTALVYAEVFNSFAGGVTIA